MALMQSTKISLGSKASDFNLQGTDNNLYSLSSFKSYKVLIIIFMCNHCPYVKAVLERLIELQKKFQKSGVLLIGINPNDTTRYPEDSMENMKKLVSEKQVSFPYLLDETQNVARAYKAVCTPDIFVYGSERTLLYHGRVDDNWKEPKKITREDLRIAIEMILEDKVVVPDQISSIGCSIKWRTK